MLTTAIIAFREFLEAFLIAGIFLGISKKLKLKKEIEILLAALTGFVISFLMAGGTYILGDQARSILTEEKADFLEGYLLLFSGLFIAYVVFSLHSTLNKNRKEMISAAHKKISNQAFDISLFFTIVFMVLREGFEIALFTASTSLLSAFMQNMLGLLLGFIASACIGTMTYFAFIKLPIQKVFTYTEYVIILLGASLAQNGVTKICETNFRFNLSAILPLPVKFLPNEDSLVGHALQSLTGLDRDFSVARLLVMILYVAIIYFIFKRNHLQKLYNKYIS